MHVPACDRVGLTASCVRYVGRDMEREREREENTGAGMGMGMVGPGLYFCWRSKGGLFRWLLTGAESVAVADDSQRPLEWVGGQTGKKGQ